MASRESQNAVHFDELYRDLILDHYRNPRNRGTLEDAGVVVEGFNPSCGDEITVALRLSSAASNGSRGETSVGAVRFGGQGCSISQSSASMLTQEIAGRPVGEVRALSRAVQEMLTDEGFDVDSTDVGDLEALSGVARFPVRVKCALLAWKVLDQALRELAGPSPNEEGPDPDGQDPTVEDDSDIQTRTTSV